MASVGILLVIIFTGLSAVSTWAERDLHAFPFKDEDWLRYLLPSRFETLGRRRIMLAGPSTVRENFRYEIFEAEFTTHDIYQGGISLGTIDDVTAALEYVENVYGTDALPEIVVLGISPRFVANIPDDRPFTLGLNLYSPYFSAVQESTRIALEPKGALASLLARARFLAAKQPERFRIGLLAVLNHLMTDETSESGRASLAIRLGGLPIVTRIVEALGYGRVLEFGPVEIIQWFISPYKYSLNKPIVYPVVHREEYDPELDGWWGQTYLWDPIKNEKKSRARLKHFADFVGRNDIRSLVINLPERDISRMNFDEVNYGAYLQLVRSELKGIQFINMREFMETDEFYDREHTTPEGSTRLTDEIIRHMRTTVLRPRADP